jgi:glycosyltransferase 2 family protein
MYARLAAAVRRFDEKFGWSWIGACLSVAIITAAAFVLYRTLRGIHVHKVMAAIAATELRDIVIAAGFVAAAYFTLTFYDLFALRTIGRRDVRYRVAALAGFTSYSIGHNVGASVFTGGAVRYRVYSAHGLSAIEVAKLCFIAGLTFWLGNAAVLGLGIAYAPAAASAIDHLAGWLNRTLAIGTLIALLIYVAWVWRTPRIIGRQNWEVALPNGPLTLVQIAIGIVDLACCAAAMYMLVPDEPYIGFVVLAVIFVSATLLGFASHSPGGLGVFDAAMLIGLWQYDKEDLLAGLLLFRLLYYITPFALALAILGGRELWLGLHARRTAPAAVALPTAQSDHGPERRDARDRAEAPSPVESE